MFVNFYFYHGRRFPFRANLITWLAQFRVGVKSASLLINLLRKYKSRNCHKMPLAAVKRKQTNIDILKCLLSFKRGCDVLKFDYGSILLGRLGVGPIARLLLQESEFESRWSLQFFCKIVVEKNGKKQKETEVGPFLKIRRKNNFVIFTCWRFCLFSWSTIF